MAALGAVKIKKEWTMLFVCLLLNVKISWAIGQKRKRYHKDNKGF